MKQWPTHLPPKTREAPPGPLGPSVVACVSAPKTMNKFHFRRNEVWKLKQNTVVALKFRQKYSTLRAQVWKCQQQGTFN
jgi:hypothetical protein